MSGQRCWAFGIMGRCELEGGHDDPHQIVTRWGDEDTVTFDGQQAVAAATVFHAGVVTQIGSPEEALSVPVRSPNCFSCGCPEDAHLEIGESGDAMCRRHQCRAFVPDF